MLFTILVVVVIVVFDLVILVILFDCSWVSGSTDLQSITYRTIKGLTIQLQFCIQSRDKLKLVFVRYTTVFLFFFGQ